MIDSIMENLFYLLPLIHKKLLRIDLTAVNKNILRPHFVIMDVLNESGPLPISEIGKRLLIPKAQMTPLVDRLIRNGMAERLADAKDRRITNIALTDKGRTTFMACRKLIRESIREKLSSLKDEELKELSKSLEKLIDIGAKLG